MERPEPASCRSLKQQTIHCASAASRSTSRSPDAWRLCRRGLATMGTQTVWATSLENDERAAADSEARRAAQIEWVNHASFVFDYDGVRLIADPWIEGRAFNDGWSLLSDTAFTYDDFRSITHLWFSHEHPDHFSPPNIRAIPPDIRKTITVLFQNTLDHKVARFCESLGFREVIELRPNGWFRLSPRVKVLCRPFPDD